ncbi:RNA methyltransferase [Maribacter antarcticus]|uniref:hypothetical protein n=1 Tax=Maribacter antarcticus TaxID=505250 RepID=UPI00293425CB|nr:hypothetical protein [Maribacter antarcticus]
MKVLKNKGYQIIATAPHNDSVLLQDFKIKDKVALFFGTKRDGLTTAVLEQADRFLATYERLYRKLEYFCCRRNHSTRVKLYINSERCTMATYKIRKTGKMFGVVQEIYQKY